MKLDNVLETDAPLPADPYERLIELHRRWGLVTEKTYLIMSAIFPDYTDVMDRIQSDLLKAERETAAYSAPGEA